MRKFYKKIIVLSLFVVLIAGGLFFLKSFSFAQTSPDLGLQPVAENIGLPTTDIRLIIARIIRVALGLLGIVAVVLILYAGFTWMTAGGDEERVSQAKKIMINAVIGLAIVLSSYAIASFVISKLTEATTGQDQGSGNPVGGGDNPYFPVGAFYVDSLPQEGRLCTRNIHLAITFNREVDLETVRGNIVVQDKDKGEYPGVWQLLGSNTIAFVPKGDCGSGEPDCFAPATEYTLHFKNPSAIKTNDGQITLSCSVRAGCKDVKFITGEGVDRMPPQITIENISSDDLFVGSVVPVKVSYTDDNGLQKVDLSADNYFVGSQTVSGCKKTGSLTINWPTASLAAGEHTLVATGYDWSALSDADTVSLNLLPQHCFNNTLEADLGEEKSGPPACGGECGACADNPCAKDVECGSGFCDAGFCRDRMRINGVSPLSGGPGTIISISGNYFGSTPGKVFVNNVQASLDACGVVSWKPWQILATIPAGVVTGPIRVETASDAKNSQIDATNDDFGPRINDFEVDNIIHPGLCSVNPNSGLPGKEIALVGKRLGNAPGKIFFGQQNAVANLANWSDSLVKTSIPQLESGLWSVKVSQNDVDSNGLRFFVEENPNDSSPIISSITPDKGAKGEYITIRGKNFGNQLGRVWFKENDGGQPGDAIEGDFRFPPGCKNIWTDSQIIVKFPLGSGEVGKSYFVQVRPADAAQNASLIGPIFSLEAGQPNPGICSLDPLSGPVPFSADDTSLHIVGDYLGEDPIVYFWSSAASPTSTDGRVEGTSSTVTNLIIGQSISTQPPAGASSGPIVVYRESDQKVSNPVDFSVLDCVKNNNTCTAPNTHCCVSGAEMGLCRPNNQLCEGETLSAGYIWRFSTKDIPKIPHVVERCDDQTDLGQNLPSPSPSIQWDTTQNDVHHAVCRSASVVVEFNLSTINDIPRSDLIVNECQDGTISESQSTCTVSQQVSIDGAGDFVPQASTEKTDFLKLDPDDSYNNGKWKDNTWYQVMLKSSISAGAGASFAPLAKDRSCSPDSAYCFIFKTGAQDCRVKRVVITPYSYWTSVLEEPIKRRESLEDEGKDVNYIGNGLSSQHCVMMNMGAFAWSWDSADEDYADIFSAEKDAAKVSALANTVGVGLKNPDNAVNISAKATLAAASYTGTSPLTIDLNTPEVVDFWPKCLEACTNAEVGVRFNTTMSNKNLPGSIISGPVKLLKCNDENCFDTTPVLAADDVVLDSMTGYRVLKIANSSPNAVELEPNTIYQVALSASTTEVDSSEFLWSAARLGDPNTFSKPYNKEFTWKFKTKKDKCKISRVDVSPNSFVADFITDKKIYSVQPFSSPDSCEAQGQKLNAWAVDWDWKSSDAAAAPNVVATVRTFSSKGNNPYCSKNCVLKGSSIPFGVAPVPVCGNLVVEAGEDCDPPGKGAGCGLDCRRTGNTNPDTCGDGRLDPNLGETCDPGLRETAVGCSNVCLRTGSNSDTQPDKVGDSVCGNGLVGSGEDCDLKIEGVIKDPDSAMGCSSKCLHQGTKLASSWCFVNANGRAGYSIEEFNKACKNSISRCGNGIEDPDEDPGCDLRDGEKKDGCNSFCLLDKIVQPAECAPDAEGCSNNGQHVGSSLLYSVPSLCGDAVAGIGEDAFCERNLINNHVGNNPWVLAAGVGLGQVAGDPPKQESDIIATVTDNTVGGPISDKGQFSIACGYTSDDQCKDRMGDEWGLAENSCCYRRPELVEVFPGAVSDVKSNVCPNTAIEAVFSEEINPGTLRDNVILARGTTDDTCGNNEDVTALAVSSLSDVYMPWYKKVFAYVSNFFKNLVSQDAAAVGARNNLAATKWCAGQDIGRVDIEKLEDGQSKVIFKLSKPLQTDADYMVLLKDGIRSQRGISIGKNNVTNRPLSWKFITGLQMCEIDKVSVSPSQLYFSKAGDSSLVQAAAYSGNAARLQSIPGAYSWEYIWQPLSTDYFSVTSTTSSINTVTAKNRNGEDDIRASALIVDNMYSDQKDVAAFAKAHVIVFLCENPWPPKDLIVNGNGPFTIFPYEDKDGNNDGFNLNIGAFDGSSIPESPAGGYFNFSTYYCADSGGVGAGDDLPYLTSAVQVSSTVVSPTSSLKRFIFANSKNSDGIGIQVFSNPKHFTVSDWFTNEKVSGERGFTGVMTATKIDGYDAITDGNNMYVDALNYSSSSNKLFSNIYLFSINADARTESRRVFEQMLGNLKFNTNLTNYGYCGVDVVTPGVSTTCRTDFDCSGNEVCSVQADKLKRNYQRLRDLQTIQDLFGT